MTPHMHYEAAREHIKDGDVICIYSEISFKYFFPTIVRFFTGSPVYHTGMAVWMTSQAGIKRLMLVETHVRGGGKRIIPMSHYANSMFDITPLPETASFAAAEEEAMARIADQPYGFIDLISLGLREFFGLGTKDNGAQVCSELVADLLVRAGVPLESTHVSPGKLKSELRELGIEPTMSVNM